MVRETDFKPSINHFFLHFSETTVSFFQRNPLFRLVEMDFLANGNRFHLLRVFPLSGSRH